jgi:hypothetical protein
MTAYTPFSHMPSDELPWRVDEVPHWMTPWEVSQYWYPGLSLLRCSSRCNGARCRRPDDHPRRAERHQNDAWQWPLKVEEVMEWTRK